MSWTYLLIAVGGAAGAMARHATSTTVMRLMGPGFPFGTLTANVVGSFLMGIVVVVLANLGGARVSPLIVTGFLGAFTTFSTFSLDAVTLYERGAVWAAGGYVLASVALSVAALVAGLALARALVAG